MKNMSQRKVGDTYLCLNCKRPFKMRHTSQRHCTDSCRIHKANYNQLTKMGEKHDSAAKLEKELLADPEFRELALNLQLGGKM